VRTALVVVVVLGALAAAGCGPDGKLVTTRPDIPPRASRAELGSSAARTALAWWDALRARDSEGLLAGLTPAARRTINLAHLDKALREDFGEFGRASQANVLYTEHSPGHATVYLRIDGGVMVGSRLVRGGALMLALPFVSRDGEWLIYNASWLRDRADSYVGVLKLRAKMKRQALRLKAQEEREDK
jgi:hypothetical protein